MIDRGGEAMDVFGAGDVDGTERAGVGIGPLHVEEAVAAALEVLDEMSEGGLGGVGGAVKHRLGGEEAADGDAEQAAGNDAVAPDFDAMSMAQLMEREIRVLHG